MATRRGEMEILNDGWTALESRAAALDNLCDEARLLMNDIAEDPKDYATELRVKEWNVRYKAVEK